MTPSIAPQPVHFASRGVFCTKTPYSKREAETVRNRRLIGRNRPGLLRIYQCDRCNRWHLTHQERET